MKSNTASSRTISLGSGRATKSELQVQRIRVPFTPWAVMASDVNLDESIWIRGREREIAKLKAESA
jgi:hypothetical protein